MTGWLMSLPAHLLWSVLQNVSCIFFVFDTEFYAARFFVLKGEEIEML